MLPVMEFLPAKPCTVLRCQNPRERVFILTKSPLTEAPICNEHYDMIESGAPYRFDSNENVFYVGEDVRVDGIRMLVDIGFNLSPFDRVAGIDGPAARMWLSHCALDGSDEQKLELVLDPNDGEGPDLFDFLRRRARFRDGPPDET